MLKSTSVQQSTNWEQSATIAYLRFLSQTSWHSRFDLLNNQRRRNAFDLFFRSLTKLLSRFQRKCFLACQVRKLSFQRWFPLSPPHFPAKCVWFSSEEKWTFTVKVHKKLPRVEERQEGTEKSWTWEGWRGWGQEELSGWDHVNEKQTPKAHKLLPEKENEDEKFFFIANLINLYGNFVVGGQRSMDGIGRRLCVCLN